MFYELDNNISSVLNNTNNSIAVNPNTTTDAERVYLHISGWEAIAGSMIVVLCRVPAGFNVDIKFGEEITKDVSEIERCYRHLGVSILSKPVSVDEINSKASQAIVKVVQELLTKACILGWSINTLWTGKKYPKLPGINYSKHNSVVARIYGNARRAKYIWTIHEKYPEYNFIKHYGMSTTLHYCLLVKYGPSLEHYDHVISDLPNRLLKLLVRTSKFEDLDVNRLRACKPLIKFFNKGTKWWHKRHLTTPKKLLNEKQLALLNGAISKIEFNIALNTKRGCVARYIKRPINQPIPEEFQKWLIENQPWP